MGTLYQTARSFNENFVERGKENAVNQHFLFSNTIFSPNNNQRVEALVWDLSTESMQGQARSNKHKDEQAQERTDFGMKMVRRCLAGHVLRRLYLCNMTHYPSPYTREK